MELWCENKKLKPLPDAKLLIAVHEFVGWQVWQGLKIKCTLLWTPSYCWLLFPFCLTRCSHYTSLLSTYGKAMGDTSSTSKQLEESHLVLSKWSTNEPYWTWASSDVDNFIFPGDCAIKSEQESNCTDVSKNGSVGKEKMDGTADWNVSL